MKEEKLKSAVPVYLLGLTWLAYSLFLPLCRLTDAFAALLLSLAVFLVSSRLFNRSADAAESGLASVKIKTGDAEKDALLETVKGYMIRLDKTAASVTEEPMAGHIGGLRESSRAIFEFIMKNSVDTRQVRNFTDYYFPTALKFIESYAELSPHTAAGGNVAETKNKIIGVMGAISAAFDKQLDNLYEDKALDIRTDIEVLKNMLKAEGLGDSDTAGGGAQ